MERARYDIFGQVALTDGAGTPRTTSARRNPFAFTGREYDSETGLLYYRARYYDPRLGRFLSRDPLGYLPDMNLYRYVNNNPVRWVDPFGQTLLVVGGAAALTGTDAVLAGLAALLGPEILIGLTVIGGAIVIGHVINQTWPPNRVPTSVAANKCPGGGTKIPIGPTITPSTPIDSTDRSGIPVSPSRRRHILDTHGPGKGVPGKSEFPGTLSGEEIIGGVEKIANDPASYPGGVIPSGPGRTTARGDIKGHPVEVIVEPGGEGVITAYPTGIQRNPK